MAKRKLKKSVKKVLFIGTTFIILLIIGIKCYQNHIYKQSYEYKFLELNYTLEEFNIINNYFEDKELNKLLTKGYNSFIPKLLQEKYFMYKNLDRYLAYQKENTDKSLSDIVALVNVNRDKDYYEDIKEVDTTEGTSMLVNKYHALNKEYEAENIVKTSSTYSYANNRLNEEAYNAFKDLANAAKKEGYTILILSSYRTYEYQNELWKERKDLYGIKKADAYAARAGSSEHETGYAIDVADYYDKNDEFGKTESFQWMLQNAHKYGFILRYPEGKEELTGYSYEPWHYRYLGVDLATKVYNEGITFDEYYEFYLNK